MKWLSILLAGMLLLLQAAWAAEGRHKGVFEQYLDGDVARVRTTADLSASTWRAACRKVLAGPLRQQLRDELGQRIGAEIPAEVGFIDAVFHNFTAWRNEDWLFCKADVALDDPDLNMAGLAVRAAWHLTQGNERPAVIRDLLGVALQHPYASADAVALVAVLAPPDQRDAYLDSHLVPSELRMDEARLAVMEAWADRSRWVDIIELGRDCGSISCRRIVLEATANKEQEDASKADDLSSYF